MKRKLPLLAALAVVAAALAIFIPSAFANELHQSGAIDGTTFSHEDCTGTEAGAGETLWHFVHTGTDGSNLPSTLTATFLLPDNTTTTKTASGFSNGGGNAIVMYNITTPSTWKLVGGSSTTDTIVDDNLLNLSHTCVGPTKASPKIATTASGDAGFGATLSDTASITGGSTSAVVGGTVTFNLFGPDQDPCDTQNPPTPLYTDTVNVVGDAVPSGTASASSDNNGLPLNGNVALSTGTYQWVASYSGDSNNNPATSACDDAKEQNVVTQSAPSVLTEIHLEKDGKDTDPVTPVTGPVALGSTVHDSATVTPPTLLAPIPTGSVEFDFYTGTCPGPDDTLGDPVHTSTVTLVNGVADPSDSAGPLHAGSYFYLAHYTPDNTSSGMYTKSDSLCEPLTVNQGTTKTATEIHLGKSADETGSPTVVGGATHVDLGSFVHDKATVTGDPAAFAVQGDVTFTFYKTIDCTTDADHPSVGAGTVTLDSNGVAHPSNDEGALPAGSYGFIAEYKGSDDYKGSLGDCEPLTVDQAKTKTTTQVHDSAHNDITNTSVLLNSYVHDKATVSMDPAGTPPFTIGGTVTYSLFKGDCATGTKVTTDETVAVGTESTAFKITATGLYGYQAVYSGDSNYKGSTGVCEPFFVLGTQNGLTLGFYSNKNGEQALTGSQTGTTLLSSVSSCVFGDTTLGGPLRNGLTANSVLVDGSGNYKTVAYFTGSGGYANVKSFLLNASATNMAYMLSAQLLTTEFNICLGKVDKTSSIYVPAVTLPGTSTHLSSTLQNILKTNSNPPANPWQQVSDSSGVAKISDIISAAVAQLKANPSTTASGPNRTYQEALKDLLDAINNNEPIFL